jgi:hypothetical protein
VAHARAKLTVLGRQLLVYRVQIDGWKPADAAKAMGVSRQTAYKWLRRFRDEGLTGLNDRTSAPQHCPPLLYALAVATFVPTRLETLYGPHRLAYALGRPRSTIYGVLRRQRISRLSFIDRPTRTVVRYERAKPGELLHVDVKKLGRIRPGGGWRIHGPEFGQPGRGRQKPPATTTSRWPSTITAGSPSSRPWPRKRGRLVLNFYAMPRPTSPQKASPSNG